MTPELGGIERRLDELDERLSRLTALQGRPRSDFDADPYLRDIVERNLEIAAQCVLDMCNRIISLEGAQRPRDYDEAILRMSDLAVLSPAFAKQLAPIAGFRNVLVHEYTGSTGTKCTTTCSSWTTCAPSPTRYASGWHAGYLRARVADSPREHTHKPERARRRPLRRDPRLQRPEAHDHRLQEPAVPPHHHRTSGCRSAPTSRRPRLVHKRKPDISTCPAFFCEHGLFGYVPAHAQAHRSADRYPPSNSCFSKDRSSAIGRFSVC